MYGNIKPKTYIYTLAPCNSNYMLLKGKKKTLIKKRGCFDHCSRTQDAKGPPQTKSTKSTKPTEWTFDFLGPLYPLCQVAHVTQKPSWVTGVRLFFPSLGRLITTRETILSGVWYIESSRTQFFHVLDYGNVEVFWIYRSLYPHELFKCCH